MTPELLMQINEDLVYATVNAPRTRTLLRKHLAYCYMNGNPEVFFGAVTVAAEAFADCGRDAVTKQLLDFYEKYR